LMKDQAALDSCDFTDKTDLCDETGENVQDGTITTEGGMLSYTWAPADGTYYISCSIGAEDRNGGPSTRGHCYRGQILTVTVGGGGTAGYQREGHESSAHDHSSHGHGHDHHHRRLSSHSSPTVSCDPTANTAAPTSAPAADPADSFASLFVSCLFLAGFTW